MNNKFNNSKKIFNYQEVIGLKNKNYYIIELPMGDWYYIVRKLDSKYNI